MAESISRLPRLFREAYARRHMRYAVREEPCMTRLTTIAAMPASTALACGDDSMSLIGFDPGACP